MYRPAVKEREDGLSLLARGKGLLDGGVEIECCFQTSYSLMGRQFTKPSSSRKGQYANVVKPYVLNLPKTFVTRRGPLVLFTSPDDMIIGQSCQVHDQEQVKSLSTHTAHDLKTTNNLTLSALTYDTQKESVISEGEGDHSYGTSLLRPGHFPSVYLETLDKLTQHNKLDTDRPAETDKDSDSGFDSCSHPTSGRLSALSYQSDPPYANIVIPGGQRELLDEREAAQVRFDDNVDFFEEGNESAKKKDQRDNLTELMASLASSKQASAKPSLTTKNTKKKVSANKKKLAPKDDQRVSKSADNNSCNGNINKKTGRPPRKRTKKEKKNKDMIESCTSPTNSQVISPLQLAAELTDANIEDERIEKKVTMAEKRLGLQSARAEQRKLEIERKRQEKRELELQKKQEMVRQAELTEQISSYQGEPDNKENVEEQSVISLIKEGMFHTDLEESTKSIPFNDLEQEAYHHQPTVTRREPSQSNILKKAREAREKAVLEEMRKRNALQEEERLKLLEEERQRKSQRELMLNEEAIRQQCIADVGKRVTGKEELNYKMRLELEAQKYQQRKTPPHMFSYFRYVPPKQSKDKKKRQRTTLPKRTKP